MNKLKKILIVDDEKINIMSLAYSLRPDYDIIVATDGVTAIEVAQKHIPDLILLDIIMPEMNGFDVIIKLKEIEITKNIPVIFVTGIRKPEDEKKGYSLGAADYIVKPYDAGVIRKKIESCIKTG